MKITKSYLKQVIKEEYQRLIENNEPNIPKLDWGPLQENPKAPAKYMGTVEDRGRKYYIYKVAYDFLKAKPIDKYNVMTAIESVGFNHSFNKSLTGDDEADKQAVAHSIQSYTGAGRGTGWSARAMEKLRNDPRYFEPK